MRKIYFICCAMLLWSYATDAQSIKDVDGVTKQRYVTAKKLFKNKQYSEAITIFKTLTSTPHFGKYACYFHALSSYYMEDYDNSALMLRQILKKYPSWEQIDEARLWLMKVYLKQDNVEKAFGVYNGIKSLKIRNYTIGMLEHYFNTINDYEYLRDLNKKFPESLTIAKALLIEICKNPIINTSEQGQWTYNNIIEKFKLDRNNYKFIRASIEGLPKRNEYNVAVMLPFMFNEKEPETSPKNFAYNLYQGILLAQEDLQQQSVKVNLHVYDTERNLSKTKNILSHKEMEQMDLIIGPLYPEPLREVLQFSLQHKINMVNPLSTNTEVVKNNPYAFLLSSSELTVGEKAASLVPSLVTSQNATILYGSQQRDSIMAEMYKEKIEQRGYRVNIFKEVPENDSRLIMQLLAQKVKTEKLEGDVAEGYQGATNTYRMGKDDSLVLSAGDIGHVFLASNSFALASNVLAALSFRADSILLVSKGDWIYDNDLSYEVLESVPIALVISPKTACCDMEKHKKFEKKFIKRYQTLPQGYALAGYETMIQFGQFLYLYGYRFERALEKGNISYGAIFPAYIYEKGLNDNHYAPFVQFQDGKFSIINSIY